MSFEWQTEEDEQHEEMPLTPVPETAVSSRKSRWLLWVALLILVILAGWLVYRQAAKRTETAVAQTKSEILSSHQLVTKAVREQDRSLLVSLLSGRNDSWADAQTSLGEQGLLLDRPQFGLVWQPSAIPEETQISLNPTLDAAEISFPVVYALPDGRTVTLQHTAVYRRGDQRWLLSPPEADFWGEEQETQTANITLTYPQRDTVTAVRLAHSLQTALDKLCQLPDTNCPNDLQLTIQLSPHPDSLLQLTDDEIMLTSGTDLVLPAPTLVGLPMDDAGYQVLSNGYATQMVTAVLANLTSYECCDQKLFYQALLDWQLNELGLKKWPMTTQAYEQLLVNSLPPHLWRGLWTQKPDIDRNWQTVYALIEYLQTQTATPINAAEMQRELTKQNSFLIWLDAATGLIALDVVNPVFAETWDDFILAQIVARQTAVPPIPYPPDPLQISCRIGEEAVSVITYDPANDHWQEIYNQKIETERFGGIQHILGTEDLYLVTERMYNDAQASRFFLVQNGQNVASFTIPLETPDLFGYFYANASPDARYILLIGYSTSGLPDNYRLLDVPACLAGDCETQPVSGWLRWSPEGRQTIFTVSEADSTSNFSLALQPQPLFLGDEKGKEPGEIGRGAAPFWLDEQTYGIIQVDEEENMALVTAVTGDSEPLLTLPIAALRQLIPTDERPDTLFVTLASPSPNHSQFVVIRATSGGEFGSDRFNFLLTLNEDFTAVTSTELLPRGETPNSVTGVTLSPDGRWQFLYDYGMSSPEAIITLTDRTENAGSSDPVTFRGNKRVIWSGEWFASVADDYLLLAAPAYNYRQIIPYDLSGCQAAYWGD